MELFLKLFYLISDERENRNERKINEYVDGKKKTRN